MSALCSFSMGARAWVRVCLCCLVICRAHGLERHSTLLLRG